jgi:predicted RNA binding protein YcfA (HicA-like mRNA interferase family)
MGTYDKLVQSILSGRQDQSFRFAEITGLLLALGFSERIKGSHHIYHRQDIPEIINIQPKGSQAKPYQVKQVRNIMVKYQLEVTNE